jgi:hypothetical protein
MITTLLIYGYIGMFLFLLFDVLDFNKKTPELNIKDTLKAYFSFANILKIAIGLVFVAVIINISLMQGGEWIIKYVTANMIDGDTPAELCIFALLLGLANQFLWDKIINLFDKNPHKIEVK